MMRWTIPLATVVVAVAAGDKPDNSKLPVKAPAGAVILLDGKDADEWELDKHWKYADGVLVVDPAESHRGCRVATRRSFTDFTLHVEFWLPLMADQTGQARSNSGVFLGGRYEVQILDTYGHPPEDNGAGGIYKVAAPRVNASLPPEQWQSYDIRYRAPRVRKDGVVEKPRVTVVYNGVKIHDDLELKVFATPSGKFDQFAPSGPILLQNHHAAVKFRNIWLVEKQK
jgi:3-keto-disaccharide hydrolase